MLSFLRYSFILLVAMTALSSMCAEQYDLRISELMAANDNGIKDEDESREDWIELHNQGATSVSLRGWWLTDKVTAPDKWKFPDVTIPAGGYLLIWASNKDRTNPFKPLHTNFKLSKAGEYLGLYRPSPFDGAPLLVDDYYPTFPPLPADISYGITRVGVVSNFVSSGDVGRYRILRDLEGEAFYTGINYGVGHIGHNQPGGWNVSAAFDDSAWTSAATGIGFDTRGGFNHWFGDSPESDCLIAFRNVNSSLCFRRTFVVDDVNELVNLTLKMRYEDGFAAFINGVEVGRANCTGDLSYNKTADTWRDESLVEIWSEFMVPLSLIYNGVNILAIQGLNSSSGSTDFLLLPELEATLTGPESLGYYSEPTPGAANGLPASGPLLSEQQPQDPDIPRPTGDATSPPLLLTVKVIKTQAQVASVRCYSRRMYDAEAAVLMLDNGVHPDATAGDGVYSALLDTTVVAAGEMLRWRFEAEDVEGETTKLPACNDPLDTAQYFGTVAVDSSTATSLLPTFCWFVENAPDKGPTLSAFRGSCYYLTNFYDNTGHTIHGQSSRRFPKHSYNFDFTNERRFLWKSGERRVKDINLLSNYADKTKARNTLAHWVGEQCGTPSHFCQIVRVHLNGYFHGVMDMMEDSDDRMTERNGLDPEGALYKIYMIDLVTDVKKKTRKHEDYQDLIDLAAGLSSKKSLTARQIYAYDNVDLAALVNYLAVRQLTTDSDHGHKNFLMYRDTNNSREWQPIVWDVDLSAGHKWTSELKYYDDALYYMPPKIPFNRGEGSPIYDVVYKFPEIREMYVRRMRTLMDKVMQPPGTVDGILETKMRELAALVDPDPALSTWSDSDLDFARWGMHTNFVQNQPREEVERLVAEYYPNRRDYLYGSGADRPGVSGAYIPATPQVSSTGMVVISEIKSIPESGLLCEEYLILKNTRSESVDISGWTIDGCIAKTFQEGTIIPAGDGTAQNNYVGLLHLAKDALGFRSRGSEPRGGQRRFVQGGYAGQMPSEGGTLTLRDDSGMMIHTTNYVGALSPSQKSLRVTEINYHPAGPNSNELVVYPWATEDDFEYVELKNNGVVPLNLTGAAFIKGIKYVFPEITLAAGARLILAKNPTAFRVRYARVYVPLLGPYDGVLSNSSDRLILIDAGGDQVLDFEYHDSWYNLTDGSGRSLVLRTENIATNLYSDLSQWNVSWDALGTPGVGEAKEAQSYHEWSREKFTEAELADALIAGAYADPDNDGRVNWIEYALGSEPLAATLSAPLAFAWYPASGARHSLLSYTKAKTPVDVSYALLFSTDLTTGVWSPVDCYVSLRNTKVSTEWVGFKERPAADGPRRFYTLRLNYTGKE